MNETDIGDESLGQMLKCFAVKAVQQYSRLKPEKFSLLFRKFIRRLNDNEYNHNDREQTSVCLLQDWII